MAANTASARLGEQDTRWHRAYHQPLLQDPGVSGKIVQRATAALRMVAYRKEYYQRPEVIARRKAWLSTPEGKESQKKWARKYREKKKEMKAASLDARSEVGKGTRQMTGTPITPDEFRVRMKEIATNLDIEEGHMTADALMLTLLEALGYGQGVEIFVKMGKYYV